ncbi:hypothetical protein [Coleofasciculus sp. FACHB-129]|uniref:hypothetical protein n=1 Tax=Coleofasciculus sp. FACHB-129 TaxID=2692785 RepID=UPI001688677D|nr:hypothetical protein [Coleofasciculus sp. FACHB-129]
MESGKCDCFLKNYSGYDLLSGFEPCLVSLATRCESAIDPQDLLATAAPLYL